MMRIFHMLHSYFNRVLNVEERDRPRATQLQDHLLHHQVMMYGRFCLHQISGQADIPITNREGACTRKSRENIRNNGIHSTLRSERVGNQIAVIMISAA